MPLNVYKDWLGIPEGDRPPDHYELLRLVRFEDDEEKVQRNYKKLNSHVRGYATGKYSTESQDLLNELARAMLCLTDPVRKRNYDESLGREFDEHEDPLGRKDLVDVLVDDGHCSRDQAREAESFADARGLSLRDAVVQMKLVDAETASKAYAREVGRPYVDLAELTPDDSVLDRTPRNVVKRNMIVPLFIDDDTLLVASVYEPTLELEEEMRLRYGVPMRAAIATPLAVNQAVSKYYAPGMRDEAVAQEAPAGAPAAPKKKPAKAKSSSTAAGPRPRMSQLSEGEQRERKSYGILIICWSAIGASLIGNFVLRPLLMPKASLTGSAILPIGLAILVAAPVAWWVTKVYWK